MKFKIERTNLETDLPKLDVWDEQIRRNNRKFGAIKDYILEGNTYYTLREVISLNHEKYPIGDDERKYCFSMRDEKGNFLGFIMCMLFNMESDPELFIQYVVVHPEVQHKKLGSEALSELMFNAENYMEMQPKQAYAYVNKSNIPSLKMLKNLGFEFSEASQDYMRVKRKILEDRKDK